MSDVGAGTTMEGAWEVPWWKEDKSGRIERFRGVGISGVLEKQERRRRRRGRSRRADEEEEAGEEENNPRILDSCVLPFFFFFFRIELIYRPRISPRTYRLNPKKLIICNKFLTN